MRFVGVGLVLLIAACSSADSATPPNDGDAGPITDARTDDGVGDAAPEADANAPCPSGSTHCSTDPVGICTRTASDLANCGGCGHQCGATNATPSCEAGKCAFACQRGFGNCDADDANGCEASVLSDAKNCGACGHDCGAEACTNGECAPVILASGALDPVTIAVDDTFVYWADHGTSPNFYDSAIKRALKGDGDGGATLARTILYVLGVTHIHLDGDRLYYSNNSGALITMHKDGTTIHDLFTQENVPQSIVVDSTYAYWLNLGTADAGYANGSLRRGPLDSGSDPISLAQGLHHPASMAIDDAGIYWTETDIEAGAVASIGRNADDAGVTNLAHVPAQGVAIDDANVYVTVPRDGTVLRIAKTGGAAQVLAWGMAQPYGISVDATHVYWTCATSAGAVMRVRKDGTDLQTLVTRRPFPAAIAVDDTSVYWTERGTQTAPDAWDNQDGNVMRTPK